MKKYFLNYLWIFIAVFITSNIVAQEETFYTQYYVNPILINAAYAGFNGDHNISANFRNRWSSFDGSPKAYTLTYDGALTDNFGVGAQLWSERIGDINRFKFGLKSGYKLKFNDRAIISLGVSADYHRYSLSDEVLNDPNIDMSDELIARAMEGMSFLDVGLAAYGEVDNSFRFGLGLPNLVYTRINSVDPTLIDDDSEDFLDSYFIFLAYEFNVPSQNFSIEPSILFKKERLVPYHTDFNVKLSFLDDKLIGGLSYEVGAGDRLGLLIGTKFSQFQVTYSYDLSFKEFQDYSGGSHELMLGVRLPKKKMEKSTDL